MGKIGGGRSFAPRVEILFQFADLLLGQLVGNLSSEQLQRRLVRRDRSNDQLRDLFRISRLFSIQLVQMLIERILRGLVCIDRFVSDRQTLIGKKLRAHRPRIHGRRSDPEFLHLGSQRFGESGDGKLGCCIVAPSCVTAFDAEYGCNIDDMP